MRSGTSENKALPERVFAAFSDKTEGSTPLPLPPRRLWVAGLFFGVFFVIMASIAYHQIASMMTGRKTQTMFDLMMFLFQGCWVLGWSIFVLILGLLTILFLFYRESARLYNGRLIKVSGLGLLHIRCEYDLAKITNLRIENAGGNKTPDAARVRFDYAGGTEDLGDAMPSAQAEKLVAAIRSAPSKSATVNGDAGSGFDLRAWVEKMQAGSKPKKAPEIAAAPPVAMPVPAFKWNSPSSITLICANLIPLVGVLFFGWSLPEIMVLFWAESAIIGFYNVLKLIIVDKLGALFTAPFFISHYGGFMAGHFLFIYYFFVRGIHTKGPELPALTALAQIFGPLWPALLALFLSHGVSFVVNFLGRKEHDGMTTKELMAAPYQRIIAMHLTIIFGGWLVMLFKTPVPALALLIAIKTMVDLKAHGNERG